MGHDNMMTYIYFNFMDYEFMRNKTHIQNAHDNEQKIKKKNIYITFTINLFYFPHNECETNSQF